MPAFAISFICFALLFTSIYMLVPLLGHPNSRHLMLRTMIAMVMLESGIALLFWFD